MRLPLDPCHLGLDSIGMIIYTTKASATRSIRCEFSPGILRDAHKAIPYRVGGKRRPGWVTVYRPTR